MPEHPSEVGRGIHRPDPASNPGRTAEDHRLFAKVDLWIAKTEMSQRDLPVRFAQWSSVFQRFNRRYRRGVWQRVLAAWQDPDLDCSMFDSTVIRAHQPSAGTGDNRGMKRWDVRAAG